MNVKRFDQIFDIHTHTRLLNQRESMKLNEKIKDLSFQQHSTIYRHVLDENNWKIKLHEFSYEGGQRAFYKVLSKQKSQKNSTSFLNPTERTDCNSTKILNILNGSQNNRDSSMETPSLLMHDLTASIEFEKNSSRPSLRNKLNPYEEFCDHYSSNLESARHLHRKPIYMALKQYSDRRNLDIKTAIARSARHFHAVSRGKSRLY